MYYYRLQITGIICGFGIRVLGRQQQQRLHEFRSRRRLRDVYESWKSGNEANF